MGVVIVEGKGSFGGGLGVSHCNQWRLCCVVVRERRALPTYLLWGGLVYNTAERAQTTCLLIFQPDKQKLASSANYQLQLEGTQRVHISAK